MSLYAEDDDIKCIKKMNEFFDKKDIILFDVGANLGDFTKTFIVQNSEKNIFSHCFEPNNDINSDLRKNLSSFNNIKVNNFGLSNNNENKNLFYRTNGDAWASLFNRSVFNNGAMKQEVQLKTLDEYVTLNNIKNIDYLKIDTEGNELNVFLGSKDSLEKKIISCGQFEYGGTYQDSNTTLKEVYEFLLTYNYKIYDIKRNLILDETNIIENYQYSVFFFFKVTF